MKRVTLTLTLTACFADAPMLTAEADGDESSGTSSDGSGGPPTSTTTGSSSAEASGSSSPASTDDHESSGDASSSSSTGSGSAEAENSDGSGSTGDGSCSSSSECGGTEICDADVCVDAWSVPYLYSVTYFDEPCDGFGTEDFFAQVDADATGYWPGCPQGWAGHAWTLPAGGATTIDFWERGGAPNPDQFITSWSWGGPVPKTVLHEGGVDVAWDGWTATIVFTVAQ